MRALGTRHSFNDLADNGDTLVTVTGIAPEPVLDEAARTVTVGAGISYGALAAWLQERGWALHNLGSLPHISVAGATATGTHGSGSRNQILSAAIAALEYVDADGELRRAGRADPDFDGMAVGLGAFGVVVRVTLDVQPSYLVRQDVYAGPTWDRVLAELDAIMSAAYSVSLFTDWSGETRSRRRGSSAGSTGRRPDGTPTRRRSSSARPATPARRGWSTPRSTTSRWSARPARGRSGSRISASTPRPATGTRSSPSTSSTAATGAAALDAVRRLSPADHAPAAGLRDPRHRPRPALAERVLRPRDARASTSPGATSRTRSAPR